MPPPITGLARNEISPECVARSQIYRLSAEVLDFEASTTGVGWTGCAWPPPDSTIRASTNRGKVKPFRVRIAFEISYSFGGKPLGRKQIDQRFVNCLLKRHFPEPYPDLRLNVGRGGRQCKVHLP